MVSWSHWTGLCAPNSVWALGEQVVQRVPNGKDWEGTGWYNSIQEAGICRQAGPTVSVWDRGRLSPMILPLPRASGRPQCEVSTHLAD